MSEGISSSPQIPSPVVARCWVCDKKLFGDEAACPRCGNSLAKEPSAEEDPLSIESYLPDASHVDSLLDGTSDNARAWNVSLDIAPVETPKLDPVAQLAAPGDAPEPTPMILTSEDPAWMREDVPLEELGKHKRGDTIKSARPDTARFKLSAPVAPPLPRVASAAFSRAAVRSQKLAALDLASHDATVLQRTLARLADFAVLGAMGVLPLGLGAWVYGIGALVDLGNGSVIGGGLHLFTHNPFIASGFLLSAFVWMSAYFIYFHGVLGQTPGELFFRLRLVASDGTPIGLEEATLRWAAFVAGFLLFGIGPARAALSVHREGFHDHFAGTRLIRIDTDP